MAPGVPSYSVEYANEQEGVPLLPTVSDRGNSIYKPLSLLPLVALIFYDVSGGPFGIEDAVAASSPLIVILGFLILPLVWSIPEALITAEMSTTFPENSGYVAWVTAAFGPFWGFQKGFWAWISGVTDNAVYPVMILTYTQQLWPVLAGGWQRAAFLVALNLSLAYLNYRGLHIVGNAAIGMVVFTMLPFVALALAAAPSVEPRNWLVWRSGDAPVDWRTFFNVMFWNLNYWNSASCLSGEVSDPGRTIPRALGGAVVLVVTSYLVPLLTGLGVEPSRAEWKLGFFTTLAQRVGGPILGWWMVAAATVSQVGQFEAEMCSDSYQLHGMAERGFLPAVFARKSRHGTPTLGIIASSVGVLAMASFDFLRIIELLNCVYCLSELLEFSAFVALRVKYPTLARPYKIPLGTAGCTLMLLPAAVLLAGVVATPIFERDLLVAAFTLGALVLGFLLHPLLQAAGRAGLLTFRGMTPAAFKEHLYTMYVPDAGGAGGPRDEFGRDIFPDGDDAGEGVAARGVGAFDTRPSWTSAVGRGSEPFGSQEPGQDGLGVAAADLAATFLRPQASAGDFHDGRREGSGPAVSAGAPTADASPRHPPGLRPGGPGSRGSGSLRGSRRGTPLAGEGGARPSPFGDPSGRSEPAGPEFRLESITYYDRATLTPTASLTPAASSSGTPTETVGAGPSAFAPWADTAPGTPVSDGAAAGASPRLSGRLSPRASPRKEGRTSSRLSSDAAGSAKSKPR